LGSPWRILHCVGRRTGKQGIIRRVTVLVGYEVGNKKKLLARLVLSKNLRRGRHSGNGLGSGKGNGFKNKLHVGMLENVGITPTWQGKRPKIEAIWSGGQGGENRKSAISTLSHIERGLSLAQKTGGARENDL